MTNKNSSKVYIFLKVLEKYLQQEYYFPVIFSVENPYPEKIKECIDHIITNWYENIDEEQNLSEESITFNGGDIQVSPYEWNEIPLEHFEILKTYIYEEQFDN